MTQIAARWKRIKTMITMTAPRCKLILVRKKRGGLKRGNGGICIVKMKKLNRLIARILIEIYQLRSGISDKYSIHGWTSRDTVEVELAACILFKNNIVRYIHHPQCNCDVMTRHLVQR